MFKLYTLKPTLNILVGLCVNTGFTNNSYYEWKRFIGLRSSQILMDFNVRLNLKRIETYNS